MPALTQTEPASLTTPMLGHLRDFYGHGRTMTEKQSVDAEGLPLPWMTYPAIMFFEQLDLSSWRVFEYGSGTGTLYWAERVRQIDAVESNKEFYDNLIGKLPANASLEMAVGSDYAKASANGAPYDLIVIDGRWRFDCAFEAMKNISPDGVIVLDNAERYPVVCDALTDAGYIQVDFAGYGPLNWFTWTTSVFLSRTVKLPPARPYRPRATPGHVDAYAQKPDIMVNYNRAGSPG